MARPFVERRSTLNPAVDIYEGPEEVIVKVDVPGFGKDDLNISIGDGFLTITGERKYSIEDEAREYGLQERTEGDFCRRLELPIAVDADKAHASYHQGVLEIQLPEAQEIEGKKITVAVT